MERQDLVLNLHGESPSVPGSGITVLNAEQHFLPTFRLIHSKFPRLRIILEHCTTSAALEAVKQCGPSVAATITAHHLFLTSDDVFGDAFCFCKPGKVLHETSNHHKTHWFQQLRRHQKTATRYSGPRFLEIPSFSLEQIVHHTQQ
jgi:dihydroorotase